MSPGILLSFTKIVLGREFQRTETFITEDDNFFGLFLLIILLEIFRGREWKHGL